MSGLFGTYQGHYERMLNKRPSVQFENYDYDAYKRARPWLSELSSDAKILDIGCGYGQQLYILHKLGFSNLHGIEISEGSLNVAREEVGHFATLERADAFDYLKDRENEYSAVTLNDVLEHIPRESTIRFLTLIRQALRPNGVLAVRVPNMSSLLSAYSMYLDFTHICGYTEYSLMQVLDSAGFRNHQILRVDARIQLKNWRPWRPLSGLGLGRYANRILHRILYRLRGQTPMPSVFDYNLEMWTYK